MARPQLRYRLAAPFSKVTVLVHFSWSWREKGVGIEYFGPPADLVAAGVVTAELMVPDGKRPRFDAHGNHVRIHRHPKRTRVHVELPDAAALTMPGVTEERILVARHIAKLDDERTEAVVAVREEEQAKRESGDTREPAVIVAEALERATSESRRRLH